MNRISGTSTALLEVGETSEAENDGGPVKSFLEHLEDLRWTLIKCSVAIALGFLISLSAGNYLVELLMRPLRQAQATYPTINQVVTVAFGTNVLGSYQLTDALQHSFDLGTNQFVGISLAPLTISNGAGAPVRILAFAPTSDPKIADAGRHLQISLANFGPADAFLTGFHVAIYAGIALASPIVFYFIAQFVFPALHLREKRYLYRGLFFGVGLFLTGVSFCYFILMPVALAASQMYSGWFGWTAFIWKAADYIEFVSKFMLGMGLGFELPVVLLVLVKIGVLSYRILAKARPYMIVICFTLGAILTTPEVITQVMMAVPLLLLYEITIWIAWYWEWQERRRGRAFNI